MKESPFMKFLLDTIRRYVPVTIIHEMSQVTPVDLARLFIFTILLRLDFLSCFRGRKLFFKGGVMLGQGS